MDGLLIFEAKVAGSINCEVCSELENFQVVSSGFLEQSQSHLSIDRSINSKRQKPTRCSYR